MTCPRAMERAVQQRREQSRQRLEAIAARLEGLSPLNVLARGYSLTRKEEEKAVLRSAEQVRRGDRLVTNCIREVSSAELRR